MVYRTCVQGSYIGPIFEAAVNGDLTMLQKYLYAGGDVNIRDSDDDTFLIETAYSLW